MQAEGRERSWHNTVSRGTVNFVISHFLSHNTVFVTVTLFATRELTSCR